MPTRWHMMSEKQLSILIQGRNYARGNWQIIKFPGHSHAYQRELPDYDVALCKLTKFPRNPRDCACSQRHFTKPFFPLEVHIVCTATSREEPIFAHINILLSTLTSVVSDLFNYALRLDNELSARPPRGRHGLWTGLKTQVGCLQIVWWNQ